MCIRDSPNPNLGQQTVYQQSQELSPTHSSTTGTLSADCGSMQIRNESSTSVSPPDMSSIEIPEQEYPPEFRERQYDAVVISTVEDEHIATVFKYILTEYVTLQVCVSLYLR